MVTLSGASQPDQTITFVRAVDGAQHRKPEPLHDRQVNDFELRRLDHLARVAQLAPTLPGDAVISHESAALALGWPVYHLPAAVKVTRTRGRAVRTSDVHVHVAQLRPLDRATARGFPVTAPARTAVDIARRVPFREGLVVADAALRAGTPRSRIGDVLRHQWTWPGIRHAGIAFHHASPLAESPLESVVRSRVIELRLPLPKLQVNVFGARGWIARVDFDWDAYGVVGEADGRVKYLDEELWLEKLRQEALEDADRVVIRWTWSAAHVPDDEFASRLQRRLDRGLRLRRIIRAG